MLRQQSSASRGIDLTSSPRLLVLYARADALGDGLMRIPALRAARTAFPDARIVYGTTEQTVLASVLRRHAAGLVDEFRSRVSLTELVAELAPATGHAAVVDFRSIAGWLVAARLRLPHGIVYEANFPGYALSWLSHGLEPRPAHNAWRYHRMIERLAARPLPFDHRLDVSAPAREQAHRLLGNGGRLILLAANSARHKALTAEQVVPVAQELLRRGYDVVYLYSPGEGPTGSELAGWVPGLRVAGPGPDVNGVPLLEVFLALGEMADAFIGPEGGLAHGMASVLAPIVIINHGARMARWRPLSGVVEVVEARTASPSGRAADAPAATIVDALDRLLAARHRDHPRATPWSMQVAEG
jgi:ADP-heptose:LPS heptosyltransferase